MPTFVIAGEYEPGIIKIAYALNRVEEKFRNYSTYNLTLSEESQTNSVHVIKVKTIGSDLRESDYKTYKFTIKDPN